MRICSLHLFLEICCTMINNSGRQHNDYPRLLPPLLRMYRNYSLNALKKNLLKIITWRLQDSQNSNPSFLYTNTPRTPKPQSLVPPDVGLIVFIVQLTFYHQPIHHCKRQTLWESGLEWVSSFPSATCTM